MFNLKTIDFFKSYFPIGRKAKGINEGKRTQTIESIESERSVSTFMGQTGLSSKQQLMKDEGRVSLANVSSTGRRERRRKGNMSSGGIISQNSLKAIDDNPIDSDIMTYLKQIIDDLDLYVALDVQQQLNISLNVLNQLVKKFMDQILLNVRNYPKEINIMCCILKRSLLRRFPLISTDELNAHLRQFVFNKWMFQEILLINQRNIMSKKEQDQLSKNFHLVNNIAQHIVKQQIYELREFPLCKLNEFILSYKVDLDKFFEIICIAEHTLIDLILDKANLESQVFSRSGHLSFPTNNLNSSSNSKSSSQSSSFFVNSNQQQVQDVTSLAFSLEDLRIISLLISKMPNKLERFDPKNALLKDAQKLQDKLKEVFKDNLTSRNSYYFCWEVGTNQSTGYIEKLFQIDYGLTKKEKKELNQQQTNLIKIKEMLILFLLSIDSILYLMQLKRGQDLNLIQILDEYKIKQIDHIISIRQHQPKIQMDIYLEYLQLLLRGLPDNLKQGEYESILKDICLTLDRKFAYLTQQILAYKQLYLQKKNIIKSVISFIKAEQETIIKKNIKQNMLFFIRSSYINIKIITTKQINQQTSSPSENGTQVTLQFKIIQNEEITVQDTQFIARKQEDMLDEFKNGLSSEEPVICLSIKDFINYLIYTPELSKSLEDRSNIQSFNRLISDYLDLLEDKVNELPFYKNMKEENKTLSFSLVENYISKQILSECMPQNNSVLDMKFIIQAQKYSFMSEKHQCIERLFQEESMWQAISEDFKNINKMETHIDKLNLINNCWNDMVKVLMMVPGEGTGADDCLPVWIHILLQAQPEQIHTNINFMDLMLRKERMMQNETAYVFAQLQSAIEYITELTEDKIISYLKLPEDQLAFKEHCKKFDFLNTEVEERIVSPSNYQNILIKSSEKREEASQFSIN